MREGERVRERESERERERERELVGERGGNRERRAGLQSYDAVFPCRWCSLARVGHVSVNLHI